MKGVKVGIDFGSFSLRMCTEGNRGIIDELSVAAFLSETGNIIAVGKKADVLDGRTDTDISVSRVIKNGVISDFNHSEKILSLILSEICKNRIYKPNVVLTVPSDASSVEKKVFLDAITRAGAGRVCLIDGILASAFGCGISDDKTGGRMVIDMGHQTTEICIMSMGTPAFSATIRRGSSDIDDAIIRHLKKDRDIIIGPHTARVIKQKIAFSKNRDCEISLMVSGKSGIDEMPISFEVTSTEIFPYIDEQISNLVSEIHSRLRSVSPELLGDAADHGVVLCGGGARLFDIDIKLQEELGIRCSITENPEKARINGIHKIISDDKLFEKLGYKFIFKDDIRDKFNRLNEIS